MLLIAVTGPVGTGKSTLLGRLAAWASARGRRVDGFVAEAQGRPVAGRGADAYALHWLATGERTVVARRGADGYAFEDTAFERVRRWAAALPAADLVVLDEFGKVEAEGGGLAPAWPDVAASGAGVVAIAVRAGTVPAIEGVLARTFDLVVQADAPDAWERLSKACVAADDWGRVGIFGAAAGGAEASLGAVLHGALVPARGLVMASLQAAMLATAAKGLERRERVVWVAFVAAGLKALSPAGSRLRPMLGITMQGILYTAAGSLGGWRRAAQIVGAGLVGAWSAAQGFLLQYLLLGQALLDAIRAAVGWLGFGSLAVALAAWVGSWALVSAGVGAVALRRMDEAAMLAWAERGEIQKARAEFLRPSFWLPLVLVALAVKLSGGGWEAVGWVVVRATTIAFLLVVAVRWLDLPGVARWLRRKGQWGPALAFERALDARKR
jgi:nucleoside-triphosphatase THEP1